MVDTESGMRVEDRNTYDAASLSRVLRSFEERFGMSSSDFYQRHLDSADVLAGIPGFVRQSWAGFFVEWQRLAPESSFSDQVARELSNV